MVSEEKGKKVIKEKKTALWLIYLFTTNCAL